MTKILQKTGIFIVRSILGLCAILFVALIMVQIILVVGINLVSTGRGSDFIAGKINQSLSESGYSIAFDRLYYDPVRGFTVYDLAVSDGEGEFLSLNRFSVGAYLVLGPLRTVEVHAKGGTLSLARLPVSQETPETEPQDKLAPFATPDIYIQKIILSNLSFEHIEIGESVAGTAYSLSPSLRGHLLLDNNIALDLKLSPGLSEIAPSVDAPDLIELSGSLTPETLDFVLDTLSATATTYSFSAKASGNIGENGTLSLNAQAKHDDLSSLTNGSFLDANVTVAIEGSIAGPAIDMSGIFTTGNLKERGLADIHIGLKTADISEGMKGVVKIETALHEDPVMLESGILYEAPQLHLTDIKGTAPKIAVTGGGIFSTDTSLFNGKMSLFVSDLSHYSALAGMDLAGNIDATAELATSDNQEQTANISLAVSNGGVDTIKIKKLSAQAFLASLANPWPHSAKVEISSLQAAEGITLDTLSANIKESGEERYALFFKGAGRAPMPVTFDGSAALSGLTQAIPDISDILLKIGQGKSLVQLSGAFSAQELDLKLSSKGFNAKDLPVNIPPQMESVLIDLDATMSGAPDRPQTNLSALVKGIAAGDYKNASVAIEAKHDGESLSASLSGKGDGIRKLNGVAGFPMQLSILPFAFTLEQSAPLSGTIAADIDLAALSPLFLPPTQSLSGALVADGSISGTIDSPQPAATIRLNNGHFEDDANGIVFAALSAAATVTPTSLNLSSLSATDGKEGTVSGSGSFSFNASDADISVQMRNFNIPNSNMANGIIGADLSLKGSTSGMSLSGTADIAELDVMIPERFSSNIPELNIVEDEKEESPSLLDRLALNIAIEAHNQVFVRGWGLDAEFGGSIAVSGTAAKPQLDGVFESRRGRYEQFGKRFTLERANLRFQGDVPPSPYLDIEATTPAGEVTGAILLTGSVLSPSIEFSSTPALPEDEVLSRILFGKSSTTISPYQAVQLAQAIRRFSGEGGGPGFDPMGMLRSATGLDDISVETDATGAATVEAGKHLTDNVYLEFSKGKAENSGGATIQIEVTPSINIESRIGQDAQGGGGVFWKRDY